VVLKKPSERAIHPIGGRLAMILERTLVGKAALLGAILIIPNLAAAQTPSPALVVSVREDSTLAIIDPVSKRIVGRVPTAGKSHEVAVSTDGKLAFAGNRAPQGDSISVIDLAAPEGNPPL
jgi:DNA-binding beta-propeller fold protein YncE